MGITKFVSFLTRAFNNIVEEIYTDNETKKLLIEHVIYDISFVIYNAYITIEDEINDYIKIKLAIDNNNNNNNDGEISLLNELLNNIIDGVHWKDFDFSIIEDYINSDKKLDSEIFDSVIILNIINTLKKNIDNLYYIKYIKTIGLMFDGIPSVSKLIEQRRRKIKNNLEVNEKKSIVSTYYNNDIKNVKLFDNLCNIIYINNNTKNYKEYYNSIYFDINKWNNKRINIDKKIYPCSTFIIKFEKFLANNINVYFNNIDVIINKSSTNGEADYKIFKYISSNIFDNIYYIHTTDSDIIFISLIQQIYFHSINRNIELIVVRHIKIDKKECIYIFNITNIINNIYEFYINMYKNDEKQNCEDDTNSEKKLLFIWDICFIFLFLGNDHLAQCSDLATELELEFYILKYYEVFKNNKANNNILSINTTNRLKKNNVNINFSNLILYLENIYRCNEINNNKIILQKFFKININIIKIFTDRFKFSFNELLIFLKKFIIYKGFKLSSKSFDELYDDDLRKIYINELLPESSIHNNDTITSIKNTYLDLSIFNLSNDDIVIFTNNENAIEYVINYYEHKYNGLMIQKKIYNTADCAHNIINNILYTTNINNIHLSYPYLYDINTIDNYLDNHTYIDERITEDYIENIIHLTTSYFIDMKYYHTDNTFYYKHIVSPRLIDIINVLKKKQRDAKYLHHVVTKLKNFNLTKSNYMALNIHNKVLSDKSITLFKDYENYRNIIF